MKDRKRTWTHLKKALRRRFGERLDSTKAALRVQNRPWMHGKTHADYAAALREVVGRNKVDEKILLAQFYRCLDKTTRLLVRDKKRPKTLEEAAELAAKIDDSQDNVAQGVQHIGQPWPTTPNPYGIPVEGQTMMIPGVGLMKVPAEADTDEANLVGFTNPTGVWNDCTGTFHTPAGRVWNGKYWAEVSKWKSVAAKREHDKSKSKLKVKHRVKRDIPTSSGEESDAPVQPPPKKKRKAAVKQAAANKSSGKKSQAGDRNCWQCGEPGHWATACPNGPKCYACRQFGHIAKDCPDAEAKTRNDEYLKTRPHTQKPSENE
ncbi:hypothetical protein PF004_g5812 [Phytophthora fragariae]|uniref:CCHC-type domain-containing protein n=1 Tax=Phytophthora fragariae TaxID=53985 RepID=A0A6G0PEG4_9STRA|nr:hypothetical protein PF004_g5812 [Phytophthora fragariae]